MDGDAVLMSQNNVSMPSFCVLEYIGREPMSITLHLYD